MRRASKLILFPIAFCTACLENLESDETLLNFYSAHSGTPRQGVLPDHGNPGSPRTFETDDGWTVTLLDAYVTITGAVAVSCDGSTHTLDMFRGACPEDFRTRDLESDAIAGGKVPADQYCAIEVAHGPYIPPDRSASGPFHDAPETDAVEGASIYLRGAAHRGDLSQKVDFELRSPASFTVSLDTSQLESGSPLRVRPKENFPRQVTAGKFYDRLFDGEDFDAWDPADFEQRLPAIIREHSAIWAGQPLDLDLGSQQLDSGVELPQQGLPPSP